MHVVDWERVNHAQNGGHVLRDDRLSMVDDDRNRRKTREESIYRFGPMAVLLAFIGNFLVCIVYLGITTRCTGACGCVLWEWIPFSRTPGERSRSATDCK